jgi:elongation factor P
MLSISDIRKGRIIVVEDIPYLVLFSQLSKKGRAGSVLTVKLRNLLTQNIQEKKFKQSDMFPEADISETYAEYLYSDGEQYHFMDERTYEQYAFDSETVGQDVLNFLQEGTKVKIVNYNGAPITINLPPKVVLEVTEAAPAIKGNTVDAAVKVVKVETGLEVKVPMFINQGDKIRINTETGIYEEKVTE